MSHFKIYHIYVNFVSYLYCHKNEYGKVPMTFLGIYGGGPMAIQWSSLKNMAHMTQTLCRIAEY